MPHGFQAVSENAGRGGDSVFSLICRSLMASEAVNGWSASPSMISMTDRMARGGGLTAWRSNAGCASQTNLQRRQRQSTERYRGRARFRHCSTVCRLLTAKQFADLYELSKSTGGEPMRRGRRAFYSSRRRAASTDWRAFLAVVAADAWCSGCR
jgi:hypothetical protein